MRLSCLGMFPSPIFSTKVGSYPRLPVAVGRLLTVSILTGAFRLTFAPHLGIPCLSGCRDNMVAGCRTGTLDQFGFLHKLGTLLLSVSGVCIARTHVALGQLQETVRDWSLDSLGLCLRSILEPICYYTLNGAGKGEENKAEGRIISSKPPRL